MSQGQGKIVHYPPYLFEAFLFAPVDDDRSTAKIGDGVAVFSLPKRTNKAWEHLMITTSDKEKREIRERALMKHQEKLSAKSTSKAMKRHADKKYALETMMTLEKEKRESIQKTKEAERERTTAELAAWQLREEEEAEEEDRLQLHGQRDGQNGQKATKEKQGSRCSDGAQLDQRGDGEAKSGRKREAPPPPRPGGNIRVTFTPRVFPTALRESRVADEEECYQQWLKKQAESRRSGNADVEELEDLKEEERNPDWLKDKGDKCFVSGDHQGAVNAYSLAIRLNRKIPALYSNRAACHLKLRNLHKAIEDSSQALDLLTPPVAANAAARARAHDYQAALKTDPHNAALQADTQRVRDTMQGRAAEPRTQ
ncbi:Dyslexia susceptibility 1 candidate gene 1 protein [Liparis tanakae]|uniref:Dyslexia susceptibility 1 candidate gene 1 protein n=1 Tax=Liparis tanakae TaxID=230148 RepID=A0A4Z2EMY8_9TELE|nr:Dyslexia susceptibility 1 candidate gene 1 protein [Liparis tanakae]